MKLGATLLSLSLGGACGGGGAGSASQDAAVRDVTIAREIDETTTTIETRDGRDDAPDVILVTDFVAFEVGDEVKEIDEVADGDEVKDLDEVADGDEVKDLDEVAEPPRPWNEACVMAGEAAAVALPEASGSALVAGPDGGMRVLVVADSGNAGRAALFELDEPEAAVALTLPLGDGAGDDIEGLETAPDGLVWGLTSAGWLRAWRSQGMGFELVRGPVPLAPDGPWRCAADGVNCGANYEGLCLHPAPEAGACAGYAASKAKGVLVCLVAKDDAYEVDPERTIAVTEADQLSGCAYEPVAPYRLVVAGNIFSGSRLWLVADGRATAFEAVGVAQQESVVAMGDGRIGSFGDLQELTPDSSPLIVLQCPVAPGGGRAVESPP